ncbi:hypothetical protein L3Y34_009827 [Caenorhabditis briggsae]|uniref:Uncharacterized protein n=1 Tax=Caenorhabditis briggsae TaxID=6238 RepID=A0AAE9A6K2_CAEBR|nr:hypothetical protein L3Y34_009827 [Caenorhabditis briggsae]
MEQKLTRLRLLGFGLEDTKEDNDEIYIVGRAVVNVNHQEEQLYNPSASLLDLKPYSEIECVSIQNFENFDFSENAVDDFRAAEQTGYLHWEECTVAGCFNDQPQVKAVPFSTLFLHNQNNTNFGTVFEDNLLDTQNRRCYQCGRRTMREVRMIVNGGYLIVSLNRPNDVNFENFPVDEIVSMYEATWRLEGFARYEGNEREGHYWSYVREADGTFFTNFGLTSCQIVSIRAIKFESFGRQRHWFFGGNRGSRWIS